MNASRVSPFINHPFHSLTCFSPKRCARCWLPFHFLYQTQLVFSPSYCLSPPHTLCKLFPLFISLIVFVHSVTQIHTSMSLPLPQAQQHVETSFLCFNHNSSAPPQAQHQAITFAAFESWVLWLCVLAVLMFLVSDKRKKNLYQHFRLFLDVIVFH